MKIYLVGGAVRDKLLNLPVKERDYVVVSATIHDMLALGYQQVGKEFPVFLHPQSKEEYALARMERKIKPGYQGFTFDTAPTVTLEDDLLRRDLTINAMAMDLASQKIIDPYGGQDDLKNKMLRHISPAFTEDPVRVLRIARFYARYACLGFQIADETWGLMRNMVSSGEINALVAERVWKEFERALGEKNPEKFFDVLEKIHAMSILFPHLSSNGRGIQALITSVNITTDTAIRFAALLHALPEDSDHTSSSKKIISDYCHRYRVPNTYRELALLTAQHQATILKASTLTAHELLQLFYALDIFRRDVRFKKCLMACHAIALSQKHELNIDWIIACAKQATSVDAKQFLEKGFTGEELALQLRQEREKRIQNYLRG